MEKQWRSALQSEIDQVKATNLELSKDSEQLAVLKTEHEALQQRVGDLQEVCSQCADLSEIIQDFLENCLTVPDFDVSWGKGRVEASNLTILKLQIVQILNNLTIYLLCNLVFCFWYFGELSSKNLHLEKCPDTLQKLKVLAFSFV